MKSSDEVRTILLDVAESVVIPHFGTLTDTQVSEKGPGDLVTIADREAEAQISQALRKLTPYAVIVGEEQAFFTPEILDGLADAEEAWVIDPIDGTRNFTRTSPDFAMMIARLYRGEVVESWIYQPIHSAMYHAEKGAGVSRDQTPIDRRADRSRLLGAAYVRLEQADTLDLRRSWGSCGIDYPKLVEGEIDFLLYREGKPWDHLPGSLMVTEMGGRTATLSGQDYRPGVVAPPLSVIPSEQWPDVRDALESTH